MISKIMPPDIQSDGLTSEFYEPWQSLNLARPCSVINSYLGWSL